MLYMNIQISDRVDTPSNYHYLVSNTPEGPATFQSRRQFQYLWDRIKRQGQTWDFPHRAFLPSRSDHEEAPLYQ